MDGVMKLTFGGSTGDVKEASCAHPEHSDTQHDEAEHMERREESEHTEYRHDRIQQRKEHHHGAGHQPDAQPSGQNSRQEAPVEFLSLTHLDS
jgi:hypothetical protein